MNTMLRCLVFADEFVCLIGSASFGADELRQRRAERELSGAVRRE
jgi:hypothetical protein